MSKTHRRAATADEARLSSRVFPLEKIKVATAEDLLKAGISSRATADEYGDGRTVIAYAAVFNSPVEIHDWDGDYMEQIGRTAFNKTLAERGTNFGVFYNHSMSVQGFPSDRFSMPIGVPLEIKADSKGLLTISRYAGTPLADEVLELIRTGAIKGQSFSGMFVKSDPQPESMWGYEADDAGKLPLVTRLEIMLREYGPTPYPAYEAAEITGVRTRRGRRLRPASAAERTAAPIHHTDTVDETWDAGPNEKRLPSPMPVGTAKKVYALYDSDRIEDGEIVKDACNLPHHDVAADGTPGAANLDGVRNSLSRLPQTDGYSQADMDAAKAHLQAHLDDADASDGEDGNGGGDGRSKLTRDAAGDSTQQREVQSSGTGVPADGGAPARSSAGIPAATGTPDASGAATGTPAPVAGAATGTADPATPAANQTAAPKRAAKPTKGGEHTMDRMTVEERSHRLSEIRSRLAEIDEEFSGAELTDEIQTEWDGLNSEYDEHERAIAAASARAEQLLRRAGSQGGTERVDNDRSGYGRGAPSVHRTWTEQDIYDLASARQQARSVEDLPEVYHERARRALEIARFGGEQKREDVQGHVERLLDTVDDKQGTLARRMLQTGSRQYERAFGKLMATLSTASLTAEEQRALAVGSGSTGGYAVPFQLDPTIILTSDGVINPLRQLARVEQIVGKEWDGVTSAGISVSRGAEASQVAEADPTLAQPTVKAERVQGWVPFSMEIEQDWAGMRGEITRLLQDAKDMEEADSFLNGDGTSPAPQGLLTGATTTFATATANTFVLDDLDGLEGNLKPRFRARASYLAERSFYVKVRNLARANASAAGDPWVSVAASPTGKELNGFPSAEASEMPAYATTTGAVLAVLGDFKTGFLIVDRLGMTIELVPHVFGANQRPTGQRGVYAIWRNNCKVLTPAAFRVLTVSGV